MSIKLTLAVNLLLVAQIAPAFAEEPVMIGLEEGYDACGAVSETITLANVYAEPNDVSDIIDTIAPGVLVWNCDWNEKNGQSWSGIVYSLDPDKDCGPMGTPIPEPREYRGPCDSGWVKEADLTLIAG